MGYKPTCNLGGSSNKSIYLSVCRSVCLSVGLSVCLSVCRSVCLSVLIVCVCVCVWTLLAQGMVPIIVCCHANSAACNSMQGVPEDWVKLAPTKTFTPSCDMKTVCCHANSAACNSMQGVPEDWVKLAPTKTFTPSCDMKTGNPFSRTCWLSYDQLFFPRGCFRYKSVDEAVVSSYHCGPHPRGFSFEPHQFGFNLRTHNQTSVCSHHWL